MVLVVSNIEALNYTDLFQIKPKGGLKQYQIKIPAGFGSSCNILRVHKFSVI